MKVNVGFELRVGGRKVSPGEFERALREDALDLVEKRIKEKVRLIRCPDHGQTARVISKRSSGKLEWHVTGCCDKLVKAVERSVK